MKALPLFVCLVLLSGVAFGSEKAEEKTEKVRVLVFESGTKPSAAINAPRWETREIKKGDACQMCQGCAHKTVTGTDKPAVVEPAKKRAEAFICTHCHEVVWLDDGKEVEFKDKQEKEALKEIKKELKKKDTTTKPGAHVNQK